MPSSFAASTASYDVTQNRAMKILSIRQPWAYLITRGSKNIENRSWPTNYRGPVLIHASLKIDKQPCVDHGLDLFSPMKPSVIVWDLETVPDLGGFAAANDLVGKADVEIREAIGDKFPKHIYHSIVCIGALIAHWEPDHWAVDAVGAPHVGERTEKELITAFCDKIAELSPQLVTFQWQQL
jgi:hypothetical protein